MRLVGLLAFGALLLSGCNQNKKDIPLKTDAQKGSYAIGQQIGRGMKSQNLKIDIDVLAMSINDVMSGTKSRLTDEQMRQAIQAMNKEVQKAQSEEGKANLAKGQAYLDANKKKKGVKTTKSGLQYEVVKAGKGTSPKDSSMVEVHYRGTLIDGTEFDSSYKRKNPAQFPVNGVIAGWTEALKMMKPGAKWKLHIPANLAYGERGRPSIPPNSVLVFDVELLKILKP